MNKLSSIIWCSIYCFIFGTLLSWFTGVESKFLKLPYPRTIWLYIAPALIAVTLICLLAEYKPSFKLVKPDSILDYILLIIIVAMSSYIIGIIIPNSDTTNILQSSKAISKYNSIYTVILNRVTIGLIGPFVEEILYRGVIFKTLNKNMSWISSTIISSFLFALMHGNLQQAVFCFILGVACCYVNKGKDSLCLGYVLHAINNCL